MLKQTVTYTDFDGETQTDTLWFNLTETDMADMMHLMPLFAEWQKKADEIGDGDRKLTDPESLEMLSLIKELIKFSYGERQNGGKSFVKSEEVFTNFKFSAAYDAFIMQLYKDDGDLIERFMMGILPQAALAEAMSELNGTKATTETVELPQPEPEEVPAWISENREPTKAELASMTPEQLQEAFRRKTSQ